MTIARQRFDKHCLKAGIVEPERTSFASQRLAKTRSLVKEYSTKVFTDTEKKPWIQASLHKEPCICKGVIRGFSPGVSAVECYPVDKGS
jgi:hypothetical protein